MLKLFVLRIDHPHHFTLLVFYANQRRKTWEWMTPFVTATANYLATLSFVARQHLGQHFLADLEWREQIARAIRVSPHADAPSTTTPPPHAAHCWIEIGPGHGEMTSYLAGAGAPVHAIELDPILLGPLKRLKKTFPNLDVVHGDILESDLQTIAVGRRIHVYGSLPYYITSPILHHLFQFGDFIDEIHIVVQNEVAERLAAKPGSKSYGYLSVATQLYARPELVFEIPRAAFQPPPEVGSALVTLRLPGERANLRLAEGLSDSEGEPLSEHRDSESAFLEFVKLCFSQKRKTLVNNLRALAPPERVREKLAALEIRPDARAEQISIANFATLYAALRTR